RRPSSSGRVGRRACTIAFSTCAVAARPAQAGHFVGFPHSLRSTMSRTILFLCTGNYYRSRFAQIIFNDLAERAGLAWRATSRGLKIGWPGNVGAISPFALTRLAELRLDDHLDACTDPAECGESDLAAADRVIAMKEGEHRSM